MNVVEGTVSGIGSIGGDVNNEGGIFSPGNSLGGLELASYTQGDNGTLLIEIAGLVSRMQHDLLVVDGTLAASGTLEVVLLNGFEPLAGDQFDVLDFGALTGMFTTLELPPLDGLLVWDAALLDTDGVLSIRAVPETSSLLLSLVAALASLFRLLRDPRDLIIRQ